MEDEGLGISPHFSSFIPHPSSLRIKDIVHRFPEAASRIDLRRAMKASSFHAFDDAANAPLHGFLGADDYYDKAASARVVDQIAVPTLILHAQDDPFIRLLPETRAKLLANPQIDFVETRHGGHCAYLSRDPGNEIHWAEATVVRYLLAVTG